MENINENNKELEWKEINYNSIPDFNSLLYNKIQSSKKINNNNNLNKEFDPYSMFLKKKQIESGEIESEKLETSKWPEKDVKLLSDFCKEHGIIGYNSGKMPPIVALSFLKNKLGIVSDNLEERVPIGYERIMKHKSNEKTLLNG